MEPLLHSRCSSVILEVVNRPLEMMDVVLFQRPDGTLVLHRIIGKMDGGYIICGDNTVQRERVPERWILGVMTGFYPDEGERFVSVDSEAYRNAQKNWWLRYWFRWNKELIRPLGRKIKHYFVNKQ